MYVIIVKLHEKLVVRAIDLWIADPVCLPLQHYDHDIVFVLFGVMT